ncbi:MAG: putative rane protein, partial [Rhodococcus erythropolis]|nr:putative rane protein [Rhodococcus erythropolis]
MIAHHAGGIPLHNSPLHNTAGPTRSTQSSGRKIAALIALVAGFSAAFVLAPGMLTSRPG